MDDEEQLGGNRHALPSIFDPCGVLLHRWLIQSSTTLPVSNFIPGFVVCAAAAEVE